ncbi:hypothetical protein F5X99DRAFT_371061 [Biscogniauxia marginata]|nr:hypothetical protein F5X99DRAFT_371061 [Biscogniauxia marginata]
MDTDKRRSRLVDQGLTQVHTGLGILLGTGTITNVTHQQIIALINNEDTDNSTTSTAKNQQSELKDPLPGYPVLAHDTLSSVQSKDLSSEIGNLTLADKAPRVQPKSSPHRKQSLDSTRHQSCGSSSHIDATTTTTKSQTENQVKLICPWWSTPGYHCRDHAAGLCPLHHDNILDGLKDPLICSFWADGRRCTKSDKDCRFAHYVAQHRQIAPLPITQKKRTKKSRVTKGTGGATLDWKPNSTLLREHDW